MKASASIVPWHTDIHFPQYMWTNNKIYKLCAMYTCNVFSVGNILQQCSHSLPLPYTELGISCQCPTVSVDWFLLHSDPIRYFHYNFKTTYTDIKKYHGKAADVSIIILKYNYYIIYNELFYMQCWTPSWSAM